eukprot:scaffold109541_cov50-Attheya_sp.AAC.5
MTAQSKGNSEFVPRAGRAVAMLLPLLILSFSCGKVHAFTALPPRTTHCISTTRCLSKSVENSNDRDSSPSWKASFLSRRKAVVTVGTGFLSTLLRPSPAFAKEKPEPLTKELVQKTFGEVRFELEDPSGGVAALESKVNNKEWEDILVFTKEYDLNMRKVKMGFARKLLTDGKVKDDALLLRNAVTFDLIGINRASRPGRENQEEAKKYLGELKDDVTKFLEMEKTIVYPVE